MIKTIKNNESDNEDIYNEYVDDKYNEDEDDDENENENENENDEYVDEYDNDNDNDNDNDYNNIEDNDNINYIDNEDIKNKINHEYLTGEDRISINRLTKYEMVRIIGERKKQLIMGAKPMIKNYKELSYDKIIEEEILLNLIPFKIRRPVNNKYEIWTIEELEKDHLLDLFNFTRK
uniref:DNA-directed RNA polymerase n=1 Tax=viral metagenome TaxID=1070528 RepID=A0A6C0H776_9ZZZZ